ncbi:MAG TPA: hypothetical protein VGJ81_09405 [Thermoanaerobaculia bacterium]|jgi:hypothetical protein
MPFPPHIEHVLDHYGIAPDTKAALYDLYLSMGDEVLEVFADVADGVTTASTLTPDDTLTLRHTVVERYLRRNHPQWLDGKPTPSLWHPRAAAGRASGLVLPIENRAGDIARSIVGPSQPLPEGVLVLGRNAHFGGRAETISFDVVAASLSDAIALGQAAGQQHTVPGSAGETSGTLDSERRVALLWEIQPNVYKPAEERNRAIVKVYRKHRNWHVVTLAAAIEWLREKETKTFILRGEALAAAHEVNPNKPVSPTIVEHHNRTVAQVVSAFALSLADPSPDDETVILNATVMNHALRKHAGQNGVRSLMWRIA